MGERRSKVVYLDEFRDRKKEKEKFVVIQTTESIHKGKESNSLAVVLLALALISLAIILGAFTLVDVVTLPSSYSQVTPSK